jgi:predicted porin
MKKSLIALAVAGVCAAPAAFAATANVDFYGKLRISLDHLNHNIGWQMSDETSRFGFKGAEDLGGGLKAIYQWETGLNLGSNGAVVPSTGNTSAGSNAGGLGGQRNTFIGLAGDFGTALVGRYDTPYKQVGSADVFGDTLGDAQNGSYVKEGDLSSRCIICSDDRWASTILYASPKMSGFQAMGAIAVGKGDDPTTAGVTPKSLMNAFSLGATYNNGPLALGAAYQDNREYSAGWSPMTGGKKQKEWKLNAGYTIDALKLGATYEQIKNNGGMDGVKSNNYLLSAAYGMGPITLAGQYGKRNVNSKGNDAGLYDLSDITVGVVYGLSKRTSTYVAYARYKYNHANYAVTGYEDFKANAVTLGLNHDF